MKVALVHDWLTGMRGGERCLEALCELFPDAPIYTLFHVKGSVSETIERHPIIPSFLNRVPFAKSRYRYLLPFFPSAIQRLEFQQYDLVVSSSHCVAKGIRVPRETCHISYVHTPMRYIWDGFDTYFGKHRALEFWQTGDGPFSNTTSAVGCGIQCPCESFYCQFAQRSRTNRTPVWKGRPAWSTLLLIGRPFTCRIAMKGFT